VVKALLVPQKLPLIPKRLTGLDRYVIVCVLLCNGVAFWQRRIGDSNGQLTGAVVRTKRTLVRYE